MADKYVNHTGDNTNGLSEATAFNSILTGINNLGNGETLWVKKDSPYLLSATLTIDTSGYANSPKTIEGYVQTPGDCRYGGAYYGQRPEISGQNGSYNVIKFSDASFWRLRNLLISNIGSGYNAIEITYYSYLSVFENCVVDGGTGIYSTSPNYHVLLGCYLNCPDVSPLNSCGNLFIRDSVLIGNSTINWWVGTDTIINSYIKATTNGAAAFGNGRTFIESCVLNVFALAAFQSNYYAQLFVRNSYIYCGYMACMSVSYCGIGRIENCATNKANWNNFPAYYLGSGNLVNISPTNNFENWSGNDFRLKSNSVLRNAGWSGSGVDSSGKFLKREGVANIGMFNPLILPAAPMFVQGAR